MINASDGASDGVEAELLLQERPLAEQALVRPVVRRVVGLELLPTTRQQWCSMGQHAVDGKALKAQPRTGCLVACCRLDLGRCRVRMAGLPRRHRLGDLLERMRGRSARLPLLVEEVAQHALEQRVELLRVLTLDGTELSARREARRLARTGAQQAQQAVKATWPSHHRPVHRSLSGRST